MWYMVATATTPTTTQIQRTSAVATVRLKEILFERLQVSNLFSIFAAFKLIRQDGAVSKRHRFTVC